MSWTVYEYIFPSGKVYIGITSNINNRWANKGRDMSKALLARIKNANYTNIFRRKIIQYDLNNNIINEFSSITEAANFLNKTRGSIQNCLAGRTKTAFGYNWKYKDGGNNFERE